MSDRRTDRVREILDLALARPSAERAAFVVGAAGADDGMATEVISLLRALEGIGDALEPPRAVPADPAEPLTGLAIGPYVVRERIGEGGMGVVYAATDTRLARTVAVKALPPAFARDPHRRARLEQEARRLAALNHPGIATIFGIEDTARGPVLILELVPGRTLAEELSARRLGVDEAIGIARQMALALEAAHAAGIVHRDLKPANVKITPEGSIKLLDFGVAQAAPGAGWESGGESGGRGPLTEAGIVLGTPGYMSPEQARGGPVDRRADLWAFGCVLYEMLAGRRAFVGSDADPDALSVGPDLGRLPPCTPEGVRRVLERCLRSSPAGRLRDAGDAMLDLEEGAPPPPAGPRRGRRWALAGAAATLALLGAAAGWLWPRTPSAAAMQAVAFGFETPPLPNRTVAALVAVSADGRMIAYCAGESDETAGLYVRPLESLEPRRIAGSGACSTPFFSPDGRWIGHVERRDQAVLLRRTPVEGGPTETIATLPGTPHGASWGDDGGILLTHPNGLWRVMAGVPVELGAATDVAIEQHAHPELLPGGGRALYTHWRQRDGEWSPDIELISMATGRGRVVVPDASQPRYAPEIGALFFVRGSTLLSAPVDPDSLELTDEPRAVLHGPLGDERGAYCRYAVSAGGVLAYVPGELASDHTDLAWFGDDGTSATAYRGDGMIRTLRLSPDEQRVAYTTEVAGDADLWVVDLERGVTTRLVRDGNPAFPVWTPDGARIVFQQAGTGERERIEWMPFDGSAAPELLYECPVGVAGIPTGFSPDGGLLALSLVTGPGEATDIFMLPVDGMTAPRRLLDTPADRVAARFSPDGTLIAYASTETGRSEIYVHTFPALDRKERVSIDGGERPTWSADGKLFYRFGDTIFAADVQAEPVLSVGVPRAVLSGLPGMRYDTAADGTRFIMGRPRGEWTAPRRIEVMTSAAPTPR